MGVAWLAAALGLAQVEMRGGEAAPAGAIVNVSLEGVRIRGPEGETVVGWDRVRAVRGEWEAEAETYAGLADAAWRARTRLERADYLAAEPLFAALLAHYGGARGPTAAVVAEGLLRCRLRRGAHVSAIEPWLALLASGEPLDHPQAWWRRAALTPVVDPQDGLAPALAPMWLSWPAVEAFARSPPWPGPPAQDALARRIRTLAALYHAAARHEAGLDPGMDEQAMLEASTGPADVRLVAEVVVARLGTSDQRAAARRALHERLSSSGALPAWKDAWVHAALGRSLVREEDPTLRRRGVLHLLRLPARYGDAHPYLSGLALAEASVTLHRDGDTRGAAHLLRDLDTRHPHHPVHAWPALREVRAKLARSAAHARDLESPHPGGTP